MTEITTFHQACKAIIANQHLPALNWAVNYAKAGLAAPEGSYAAHVQAAYIANNISRWRGDLAKQVRTVMKRVAS